MNSVFENLYGALFTGLIAVAFFCLTYAYWTDNLFFSLCLGFLGFVFAFYSIGLFLIPLIDSFKKRKK